MAGVKRKVSIWVRI